MRGRETLLAAGVSRPFRRGQVLISAGAVIDDVLLIESGAVKVVLIAENGVEALAGVYAVGELVGEVGVIRGEPSTASVIAQRDGSAVHVPAGTFRALMRQDTDILLLVNDVLSRRLRTADDRNLGVASRKVQVRVAGQLLTWADLYGEPAENGVVVSGITQRELAQAVVASEKHVEVALRGLRDLGFLGTGRRRYHLPDPESLASWVNRSGR